MVHSHRLCVTISLYKVRLNSITMGTVSNLNSHVRHLNATSLFSNTFAIFLVTYLLPKLIGSNKDLCNSLFRTLLLVRIDVATNSNVINRHFINRIYKILSLLLSTTVQKVSKYSNYKYSAIEN